MERHDDLLRTDAYGVTADNMHIGRIHIDPADALVADTDGIMLATKRVKTTVWVPSSATQICATDDTLAISAPTMMGADPNGEVKFLMATAADDVLAVSIGTGEAIDTVTISLAKTTPAKNTAALIQAAIRALLTVNGIDVTAFVCVGSATWDANAVAKKNDTVVAMASGVTGTVDEITVGLSDPPQARNATATSGGTGGDIANIAVTVYGLDMEGVAIEETLPYFTANSATTVVGKKAFSHFTKVAVPSHDGPNATTAIGFGSLFGLPYKLDQKLIQVAFDGVFEATPPTIVIDEDELCNNTIEIAGTLNGEKAVDFILFL